MKKFYNLIAFFIAITAFAQMQTVTHSINPVAFNEDESITITFTGNSINESTWGVTNNALYLWAWSYDANDANSMDSPTNGTWDSSNEANKLTYNAGNDTYTMTFVPSTFYNRTNLGRIGFLVKTKQLLKPSFEITFDNFTSKINPLLIICFLSLSKS